MASFVSLNCFLAHAMYILLRFVRFSVEVRPALPTWGSVIRFYRLQVLVFPLVVDNLCSAIPMLPNILTAGNP